MQPSATCLVRPWRCLIGLWPTTIAYARARPVIRLRVRSFRRLAQQPRRVAHRAAPAPAHRVCHALPAAAHSRRCQSVHLRSAARASRQIDSCVWSVSLRPRQLHSLIGPRPAPHVCFPASGLRYVNLPQTRYPACCLGPTAHRFGSTLATRVRAGRTSARFGEWYSRFFAAAQ